MAATSSGLGGTRFGNIDVATETMIYFAQRGQDATDSLKRTIESSRKDARTQKEIEAETRKLKDRLDGLLAGIPDASKPGNLAHIQKLLKDIADNQRLADEQRKAAREILSQLGATTPGKPLHDSLPANDWKRLQALTQKYDKATGPVGANKRGSVLAWVSLYSGSKNGQPFIGTPVSTPKASKEDIAFLNQITAYLNERPKTVVQPSWSRINPQLKNVLGAHFESLKPTAQVEDDSVRSLMVQLALQNFNNAINGGSASAKSIHDTKKSVTDRI